MEGAKKIKIKTGQLNLEAELYNTRTARAIWDALPVKARVYTWGDEIYFSIPVDLSEERDSKSIVEIGDLGYWPTGNAFCIFFGPTPVSTSGEIRPASAVNVFGKVLGDALVLKSASDGEEIIVEKLD